MIIYLILNQHLAIKGIPYGWCRWIDRSPTRLYGPIFADPHQISGAPSQYFSSSKGHPRALILARNEASRSGTGARFSALYEYCMSDATIFVPFNLKTSYLDAIIARCFVVRWDINID